MHKGLLPAGCDFLLVGTWLSSLGGMSFENGLTALEHSSLQGHIPQDSSKEILQQASRLC